MIISENNYSIVIINDSTKHLSRHTINEWEVILPDTDFIRVHRRHIINIHKIPNINPKDNIVKTEFSELSIGRSYKRKINEILTFLK